MSNNLGSSALTLRDPWSMVPALGNLDAYVAACQRIPMLTPEEETLLAQRLRKEGDVQAAGQLVLSHLRLVISIARQYSGYGLPHGDLIQEGNVGLMKAVKRFDPDQGVRLVTYAMHWIKAEIHEYIVKNWRLVRIATTKSQRKLFFNLRTLKRQLRDEHQHDRDTLTSDEVDEVAKKLNVKREDVLEMETRLSGGDVALEAQSDDAEDHFTPIHYLRDDHHEPTQMIESHQRRWMSGDGIKQALNTLDERSRKIVEQRWLKVNDNNTGGATLHDLAQEFGVSAERIRQIEVAAMKKMKASLTEAS